jgi:hypothetical protein
MGIGFSGITKGACSCCISDVDAATLHLPVKARTFVEANEFELNCACGQWPVTGSLRTILKAPGSRRA